MKERRARKRAPKRNRGPNRARARPRTVSAARGTFEISASSSSGEAAKDDKSKSKSDDGGSHSSFSDSLLRELDAELGLLNDDDAADNGKKEETKLRQQVAPELAVGGLHLGIAEFRRIRVSGGIQCHTLSRPVRLDLSGRSEC